MNRLDKRFIAWGRGETFGEADYRGYTFMPTHLWHHGRCIAVRARSPVSRKTTIWMRACWPDGGLIDSQMDAARHFSTKQWLAVEEVLFREISDSVSIFSMARNRMRMRNWPREMLNANAIGRVCRLLIKRLDDDHAILNEPDEVLAWFCLLRGRDYVAMCAWHHPDDKLRKAREFKNYDEAVLHKMKNSGALYSFKS